MIGKQLFFSTSNEDGNSEIAALRPEGKRVLCIAACGSRAFDLLLANPREVVAIDGSLAQTSLTELQAHAMRLLSREQFLAFIGINQAGNRLDIYRSVRSLLSPEAAAFWDGHESMISSGVIYAGKWERIYRDMARGAGLLGKWRDRLFAAKDVEEQYAIWKKADNWMTRALIRLGSSRWLWKYIIRDPGIWLVSSDTDIAEYMFERANKAVRRHLLRECPLAWLIFYGKYAPGAALPLFMQAENYERIRTQIHKVTVFRSSLKDFLKSDGNGGFDAFSLSDFSSYTGKEEYRDTCALMIKRANPGARFCERNYLVRYPAPFPNLKVEAELSEQLERQDKSLYYTFSCGSII